MSVARPPFVRWKSCSPGRVATLVGVLFFAVRFALSASVQSPRGVFSLVAAGKPAAQSTLDNPDVVGVSIRQDWADLEPSEGSFDWSFLDYRGGQSHGGREGRAFADQNAGRQTGVGDRRGSTRPEAFSSISMIDGVPTSIPVFWDPTFLAKKKAMITALGGHLDQQSGGENCLRELCERHQRRLECAAHRCRGHELVRRWLHDREVIGYREADHRHHDGGLSESVCDTCHRRQRQP